ncbi:monovalent cation/H+ antiporter complex subunit F [Blastomonas sp.]|uniref:monovalent cation/H+ antiporter complex subunit F n=1 Tax=Blastomonas sp. TaxID=1909299 RepID=UPI00261CFEEA|nr:monovalent cation/H+ antiporter complex subunit F [Blastomonas sp.]MDM7955790.1 monovalent cation/H+ antiporter complex subunit F [Blastomonas sp.]
MSAWFLAFATLLLLSLAGALWRIWRGPEPADRMMAAQLVGTGGVGVVLLLAAASDWQMLDVALVLALLAAFAAIAFVKAQSVDGSGDPEEDPVSPAAGTDPTTIQPGRAPDAR